MHQGKTLYSKIASTLSPVPSAIAQRVKAYLDDLKNGNDVKKYENIKEVKYVPPQKTKSSYKLWYNA